MLYCALATCLTSISIGYVIGSPNIPEAAIRGEDGDCGPHPYTIQAGFPNCFEFSDLIWGFAVGSFCLGACAGGLMGGGIQNKIGRVKTMLVGNVAFILGALILGLTYNQAQFVIGRIVIGFACGVGGVAAPTYLSEIATAHARGTLGTFHQFFLVIGLVISNLVGLAWSSPPGWRIVLAANAIPALLQCLILPTMVESPRHLVCQQRIKEAQDALRKLRGPEADIEIHLELNDMKILLLGEQDDEKTTDHDPENIPRDSKVVQSHDALENDGSPSPRVNHEPYGILELFQSECRGLAAIGIMVHFLQQASGINGLVYYSTSFLGNVFGSGNSKYITIGVSCCNLLATALSVYLIDRFNRKTLLMASFTGMSVSALLLVIGAYCNLGHLVVVAVFLYIALFAIALGPIPWMLLSEMLPTYALSSASSIGTGVNWGTNFIIGLVFPSMTKGMGNGTFILFGAFNIFGVIFIGYFVPETRGRSIESVMAEMGVPSRASRTIR
ncbi:major facilitator superfamily domain-containing protein [Dissophora ornata]|nr:major facilitator superfamily domain-containing protein [Dissophora ornata]